MIKRLLILFLALNVHPCLSQVGYHKLYYSNNATYGQDICKVNAQRFAVVGKTFDPSVNFFRAYILLTNENGDTLWSRIFHSIESMNATSVLLMPDSNLIVSGSIGDGIFLIKIDANGNTLLSKTIRQASLFFVDPRFSVLPDTGLMVGAVVSSLPNYSSSLFRLDKDFNMIWVRYYSHDIFFRDLVSDTSGTVICGDKTTGINLLKVSPIGNILWNKRYNFGKDVQCRFINKTLNNDFLVGGLIDNLNPPYFVGGFLVKTDFAGNDLWSRIYFPGVPELFNSVSLPNNDFAIFSIYPYYNSYNTTLFVTDSDGVTRWAKSYKTYNNFSTFSGVQTDNGDYYIAASGKRPDLGQNNTSAYFIKTDSLGNSSCSDTTIANLDSTYSLIEDVWSLNDTIANLSSQNLNLTTNFNFSIYDICNSIISANSINDIGDKEMVYPNPFSDIIYIESENKISEKSILTIYNYSGECILKINLEQTINRIDLSGFANGVYHIKVKCAYKEWSKNIIKL